MSNKQCEEKLKDRGVRPTAARILVLNMLAKQTAPISLMELEILLETLDKIGQIDHFPDIGTIAGTPCHPCLRRRKRLDEI